MSTIRIKKVKYSEKANKIIMTYEKFVNDQYDEYNFNSSEAAAPEFYEAFEKLAKHAATLCELPNTDVDHLKVYGVTFSYSGEDGIMGATMSLKKELQYSNTDLILNTPHKKSAPDSGDDFNEIMYLTEECVNDLWDLEAEARKYIDGKRAQGALFNPDSAA